LPSEGKKGIYCFQDTSLLRIFPDYNRWSEKKEARNDEIIVALARGQSLVSRRDERQTAGGL
jgi:hypothetical protein